MNTVLCLHLYVSVCVYEQNLEKIITKDFYPDLPKLQAQAEYLDAVERKDTQKMWELQQKFSRKRTAVQTPGLCKMNFVCHELLNFCSFIAEEKNIWFWVDEGSGLMHFVRVLYACRPQEL